MMIISIFREHLRDTGIAKEDTNNLSTSKCWNQVVTIWKEKASPTIDLSDSIAMFDSYVTTNLTCVTKKNEMYLSMLEKLRQTANEYQQKIFQTIYFDLLFGHLAKTGEECFITFCNIFLQNPGYTETGLELCKSCKACCLDGLNGTWFHVTESCSVPSAFALSSPVDSSLSKVRKNTAVFVLKGIGCNEWFEIKEDEIRIETALAFPKNHKKIIPVYYGILVDDCRKRDREFYCHLTKIGGYHKRVESDEQFATRIAENVMRLAWDQHQSNSLTVWKPGGDDWKTKGDLGNLEQLSQLRYDLPQLEPVIEDVLDILGAEGKKHFLEAIGKGKMNIARMNLDLVGAVEAGKSSLSDSLTNEIFIDKRESSKGASVIYMVGIANATVTDSKSNSDIDKHRSHSLGRGGCVLAQDTDGKPTESKAKLLRGQSLSESESGQGSISTPSVTVANLELMSSRSGVEDGKEDTSTLSDDVQSNSLPSTGKPSQVEGINKQVLDFQKEFKAAKDLTEDRATVIKSLKNDPEERRKQTDLIYISVCDRGGQQHFLPIHTALMANCNEFIPKAYLLVFDLTKRLGDVAAVTYRAKRAGKKKEVQIPHTQQKTSEQIIGQWASAVELAHPKSEMRSGKFQQKKMKPYLGYLKVRRGPPMFVIGTHYDEIVKDGDEGKELVRTQEETIRKLLAKHEYTERVVQVEGKNEVIFKVDNTRSGTDRTDPMVNLMRKQIFEMAKAYSCSSDVMATPLPYVVLEHGLLNVSQPQGPDSACDSNHKIVNLNDIVHLAKEYCNIEDGDRCQTALKYLSSVGAIFYFFKVACLRDKVFPDPQWLVEVMSTFVTILDDDEVGCAFTHDLGKLKETGVMSRELAEHLLKNRQELGVRPKHYNTIFQLLHLFDIFYPHRASAKLSVDDAEKFDVPCLLDVDYKEDTAWELSGAVDSTPQPPSLIFKPDNVDFFPEQLFFRLLSRTAYEFPESPKLKRNRIQVYFDDSRLKLELLYHHTGQYVIATVEPGNKGRPPTAEIFNRQCAHVRQFLLWQLNDAKQLQNGMSGFRYQVYFQHGKKPHIKDVDEDSLYCLPDCYKRPKVIRNLISKLPLYEDDILSLSVNLWYSPETPDYGDDVIPTESELVMVAASVQDRWEELAGVLKPRPFYRNELIKFDDNTDNSKLGQALRMLQEWKLEHKDQATTSNLKMSLDVAKFQNVAQKLPCDCKLIKSK